MPAACSRFDKVPPELDFPRGRARDPRFWKERGDLREDAGAARRRAAPSSSTRGRPRPTACRTTGTCSRASSRTSSPATRRCAAGACPRKAGWDTHGLPVEVEVEKELRIHGKAAIEEYGVEPFIKKCIESVFRYTNEWEELTERVAFWVDLRDAYVTYHRSYVESVWWALSRAAREGAPLPGAQGRLVVGAGRHGAQLGRGGAGVQDGRRPERVRRVPAGRRGQPRRSSCGRRPRGPCRRTCTRRSTRRSTTSSSANKDGRRFVAREGTRRRAREEARGPHRRDGRCKGTDSSGTQYRPPFELFARRSERLRGPVWRVIAADFVTLDAGTGIVHVAPAFGEDDHERASQAAPRPPGSAALLRGEARRHVRRGASIATPAAGSRTATRRSSTT